MRWSLLVGAVALLAGTIGHGPAIDSLPSPPAGARFDEPEAAARFALQKRIPPGSRLDTRARCRAALERLDSMPRFSTAAGRRLPSARDMGSGVVSSLGTWMSLGPGNIGGRTRVLLIDPTNPDALIAAGISGGVWKTADAGASWRPVGQDLANIGVNAMAISPTNAKVLVAGTGEGYFREVVRGTGLATARRRRVQERRWGRDVAVRCVDERLRLLLGQRSRLQPRERSAALRGHAHRCPPLARRRRNLDDNPPNDGERRMPRPRDPH